MSTESTQRVPMLVPGVDVRALPLGALEGFLLSRIDGAYTLRELGEMTGLGVDAVTDIVARLVSLGAVSWKGASPPSTRPPVPPAAPAAGRTSERPKTPAGAAIGTPGRGFARPNAVPQTVIHALYDPAELEEDVDLERDRRRQILDTFYQLESRNYYELLGIARDADKKDVRASYFALSKVFHPDTMFRRRLGTYKTKMEVIFRRLTEAYETLGKKKTRDSYDDYLAISEVTQGTQQKLAEGEKVAAREAERVGATPVHGVPIMTRPGEMPPPPVEPRPSPPPPVPMPSPSPPPVSVPSAAPPPVSMPVPSLPPDGRGPPTDEQRRRMQELLQYRLQSVSRESVPPRASAPPVSRPADPQGAGRELVRSLQQTATLTGTGDLASRHLADGLRAERDGKLVEAVNALGIARAVEGEREDVIREHDRLRKLLAVELADTYLKQAKYEEQLGKWGQAALSWARVCEGRPEDVTAHRRAADALLRTNGDLHRARSYAQRAVELAPNDAKARVTLGRVFIAAGLKLNAKRELEIAAKLDPADDLVKNLLRDLK
jgi:tetratricopeptide (TPR) repeat protein